MADHVSETAALVVAVGAALTTIVLGARKIAQQVGRWAHMFNEAYDALLGRSELRHPDTGLVLVSATPGLGKRLADMENALRTLADADDRLTSLEKKFDDHQERSQALEVARVEEQRSMWDAIKAVAQSSPTEGIDVLATTEQEVTVTETRRRRTPTT